MSTVVPEDPFGPIKNAKQKTTPSPEAVNQFHARDDVDSHWGAHHHTLGVKHDQAAAGDHKHDGNNSKFLLEDVSITGSTDATVISSIIDALERLGATNNTTGY